MVAVYEVGCFQRICVFILFCRCIEIVNCSGFIPHSIENSCSLLLPSVNSFVNIGTIGGDPFLLSGTRFLKKNLYERTGLAYMSKMPIK